MATYKLTCPKCGTTITTNNPDATCMKCNPVPKKKKVDLIASGYEWVCLACEHHNKEVEITNEVTCAACATTFEAGDAEHAYH